MFSRPWGDGSRVRPRQAPCVGWDGGAVGMVRTLGFGGGESKTALTLLTCPQLEGTAAVGGTCSTSRGWGMYLSARESEPTPSPGLGEWEQNLRAERGRLSRGVLVGCPDGLGQEGGGMLVLESSICTGENIQL